MAPLKFFHGKPDRNDRQHTAEKPEQTGMAPPMIKKCVLGLLLYGLPFSTLPAFSSDYTIKVFGGCYGEGMIVHSFSPYQVWWAYTEYGARIFVLRSETNDVLERNHRARLRERLKENAAFTLRIPAREDRRFREILKGEQIIRIDVRQILTRN